MNDRKPIKSRSQIDIIDFPYEDNKSSRKYIREERKKYETFPGKALDEGLEITNLMIDRIILILGIICIITGLFLSFFAHRATNEVIDEFNEEIDIDKDIERYKELSKQISLGTLSMPVMTLGLGLFLIVIARRVRRINK